MFESRIYQEGELDILHVSSPACQASFSLQGGQLLSYEQTGQPSILWHNNEAIYRNGLPVRQGIPICWPWFGDLARNPEPVKMQFKEVDHPPAHGWVRQQPWQLMESQLDSARALIIFSVDCPNLPLQTIARYEIAAEYVSLTLTTKNIGNDVLHFSFALHTYFAVGNISHVSLMGLDGKPYIETLDNWQEKKQQGSLSFNGETDRIYLNAPDTLILRDDSLKRDIMINARNSRSVVVWNPWIDKAARMSQFPDQDYTRMLCVETARIWEKDFVTLEPGQQQTTELRLSQKSS
ncbi:MAG: D-hexose-6-phosphate mutarotase [Hahellaceae bacterium]|nr:D-hexose-6-phosphate mutarotase [Hahellaceae bacterium]